MTDDASPGETSHATPAAEVVGRYAFERFLLIRDDEDPEPVRVRWTMRSRTRWRCDVHGPMRRAECSHTFAAGLVLADELLGLTQAQPTDPDQPQQEGHPR